MVSSERAHSLKQSWGVMGRSAAEVVVVPGARCESELLETVVGQESQDYRAASL